MVDKLHSGNRRRYLRYRPDSIYAENLEKRALESVGFIDLKEEDENFDPTVVGLVADKSHAGCSLAIVDEKASQELKAEMIVRVKAGPLAPLKAVIRWVRKWDEGLLKVGVEFLE